MKRLISLMILIVAAIATIAAQNRIDSLVDNFSSQGNSTFTSAVERDSKTNRIKKVVKRLVTEGKTSNELRQAFEAEKHIGTFSEKFENNVRVFMLTTQDSRTNRIYMLRLENERFYPKSETTIIIKFK